MEKESVVIMCLRSNIERPARHSVKKACCECGCGIWVHPDSLKRADAKLMCEPCVKELATPEDDFRGSEAGGMPEDVCKMIDLEIAMGGSAQAIRARFAKNLRKTDTIPQIEEIMLRELDEYLAKKEKPDEK